MKSQFTRDESGNPTTLFLACLTAILLHASVAASFDESPESRFRGVPDCLLPRPAQGDRLEIVHSGPRNLEARPFDYRNPFRSKGDSLADDHEDGFDYYVNDNAAIGLPDGPECAVVDRWGTLRYYGTSSPTSSSAPG